MGFGDPNNGQHSWTIGELETRDIIKAALEGGINFFDTSIGYQIGTSEQYVGRALRDFAKRELRPSPTCRGNGSEYTCHVQIQTSMDPHF